MFAIMYGSNCLGSPDHSLTKVDHAFLFRSEEAANLHLESIKENREYIPALADVEIDKLAVVRLAMGKR